MPNPLTLLNHYQQQAVATLVDDSQTPDNLLNYLLYGLLGGAGDVADVRAKFCQGGYDQKKYHNKLKDELGNVLWFMAVLAQNEGISMSEIATNNINRLHKKMKKNSPTE